MEKITPFRELSGRDKAQYIFDYYKFHILGGILLLIAIISVIYTIATHVDPTLSVVMINADGKDTEPFETFLADKGCEVVNGSVDFPDVLKFDENGNTQGSYYDDMILSVYVGGGDYDLFFGTGNKFKAYADEGCLMDLRLVLSEETFASIPEEDLLWCTPEGAITDDGTGTWPCAVLLTGNSFVEHFYGDTPVYYGVLYNRPHPELANEFSEYLLQQ